jgi:hypothetical protein
VLDGAATWKITGGSLVIRKGSGASVTYSSSTAPAAQTTATGLVAAIGRAWTLTSVTSAGRTRVPNTGQPTTLHLWSGGEAQSDGAEWSWHQSGSTLVWTRIWPTGVAASASSDAGEAALVAILQGTTSWSLEGGDKLVISSPAGSRLSFWAAAAQPIVGTAAVQLSAEHGCGVQVCGRGLVPGAVTIANTRGIVVWQMPVTPGDQGNDLLQAGTYTVTATIRDGVCTPATVTVVLGRSSPVSLSCRDGLSKD